MIQVRELVPGKPIPPFIDIDLDVDDIPDTLVAMGLPEVNPTDPKYVLATLVSGVEYL